MPDKESAFHDLTADDFDKIRALASPKRFRKDELVFSEGDVADNIYFIESGKVSVQIQKFADQEEIATLGPGEYFGEMAFFDDGKRNASIIALTDANLLSVSKNSFLDLLRTDKSIAGKIRATIARRQAEHFLREKLVDMTGLAGNSLHISIKGDQSMKETTFTRERYESVVDKVLPQLEARLEDLLLNRCVYQIYIGFNNGEIRTSSVFDPFGEEIHQASKMAEGFYIERHFSRVSYAEKTAMLKRLYSVIQADPVFQELDGNFKKLWGRYYERWKPLPAGDITNILCQLHALRKIPNYYLRNITVGIIHNAIRMQFNCDGTHIVSADDYRRFIDENL